MLCRHKWDEKVQVVHVCAHKAIFYWNFVFSPFSWKTAKLIECILNPVYYMGFDFLKVLVMKAMKHSMYDQTLC